MEEKKLLTRREFLALTGTLLAGLLVMKFAGPFKLFSTTLGKQTTANADNTYGNHTYGGKKG